MNVNPPPFAAPQLMVLELSLGIAAAIRHLHSKQVVHGDLNPRNVLLKRDSAALAGYVPKVRRVCVWGGCLGKGSCRVSRGRIRVWNCLGLPRVEFAESRVVA